MLSSLVLNGVGGEVNDTNFVAIDNGGAAKRIVKLLQEMAQPVGFGNSIRNSAIFGFSTGPRHYWLRF
jgi:hypothetical protein